MTEKELEEIKDSIDLQMIAEQANGYKERYSDLLTEEINLYNEVIRLKELVGKKDAEIRLYKGVLSDNNRWVHLLNDLEDYNQEIVDKYDESDMCEYCDGRVAVAQKNLDIMKAVRGE